MKGDQDFGEIVAAGLLVIVFTVMTVVLSIVLLLLIWTQRYLWRVEAEGGGPQPALPRLFGLPPEGIPALLPSLPADQVNRNV